MEPEHGSFWEHLDALRGVLLRCAVLVTAVSGVLFAVMPWIFDNIILAPCGADFPLYQWMGNLTGENTGSGAMDIKLINVTLASQFFVHVSTSLWLGLVLSVPGVLWLLWGFLAPGLYPHERRGASTAMLWGAGMFAAGVIVAYYVVFPLTLRFLSQYQISSSIDNIISLESYIDTFMMLTLLIGVMFELPVLTWLLGKMGVVDRAFFSRYRRHAIAALLVVAAVITPTGDPFTMSVVFVPLYLLWEAGALSVPRRHGAIRLSSE